MLIRDLHSKFVEATGVAYVICSSSYLIRLRSIAVLIVRSNRKQDERRISVYRQKRYFLTVQNAHFELPFFVVETEIAIDIPESAVYYEDVEIFSLCYPTMNDRIAISRFQLVVTTIFNFQGSFDIEQIVWKSAIQYRVP